MAYADYFLATAKKSLARETTVQCSISTIGKDRCTVTMESASDRRRRLARERLQRCHLTDLKLFFLLAFSHSRSPAYVRTALLVHVTMQIFVVVLVVVVFVVSCNWFFPANHKCVSVCFCLHVFSIALHSYCCARLSCACVYL